MTIKLDVVCQSVLEFIQFIKLLPIMSSWPFDTQFPLGHQPERNSEQGWRGSHLIGWRRCMLPCRSSPVEEVVPSFFLLFCKLSLQREADWMPGHHLEGWNWSMEAVLCPFHQSMPLNYRRFLNRIQCERPWLWLQSFLSVLGWPHVSPNQSIEPKFP